MEIILLLLVVPIVFGIVYLCIHQSRMNAAEAKMYDAIFTKMREEVRKTTKQASTLETPKMSPPLDLYTYTTKQVEYMPQVGDPGYSRKIVDAQPGDSICGICQCKIDFYAVPLTYKIIGAYMSPKKTNLVTKFVHTECAKKSGIVQ